MIDVLLLSREDCRFCVQAKETLERLRAELGLRVREQALDSEEGRRLALSSAALFPPVVLVEGEVICYGRLSERRLRKVLARRARESVPVSPDGRGGA